MLTELRIRDLGVIADTTLVLDGGMTAVTGETGAGKTMIVEAVELLVGGRADPVLVRPGAVEAWVEGRFVVGDEEVPIVDAKQRRAGLHAAEHLGAEAIKVLRFDAVEIRTLQT